MKQILKQIVKAIFSRKGMLLLATLALVFFHPDLSFASSPESTTSGDNSDTVQKLAETLSVIISFLNTLLWPLLLAIGDLMDVDMIIGPGMESRLLDIWVQVRNLVNVVFVLVLVAVAFYNVLGLGGGEGELAIKTALPKIVIGLVLVNFTYVGGRVVLDVVNVGTTIAFGLPEIVNSEGESGYSFDPEVEKFEENVCLKKTSTGFSTYTEDEASIQTKIFCELNESGAEKSYTLANGTELTIPDKSYGGLEENLKQRYFQNLNKNNVALVMAVNMNQLGSQELFKEGSVKTFKDLTVNLIFSTLMYLVLAVSYIVLAIVLLVRVIVLWLALALSPIAVLTYTVPQVKEWLGGGGDFSSKVVKHLISPIIIGFTLSMGYLLMSAWNQVGATLSSYSSSDVDEVIQKELLISGIDDLPKLVLAIASIVVVWMGVFSAAEGTYAQGITDKIKGVGDSVKEFAFKAPMLAPILPISANGENKEGMSPLALGHTLKSALDNFDDHKLSEQLKGFEGTKLGEWAFGRSGHVSDSPEMNKERIHGLLANKEEGSLSTTEAEKIAQSLYYTVKGNDEWKKDEGLKTKVADQMEVFRKAYAGGDQDLGKLQRYVKDNKLTHEDLGISSTAYQTLMELDDDLTEEEEKPKAEAKKEPSKPSEEKPGSKKEGEKKEETPKGESTVEPGKGATPATTGTPPEEEKPEEQPEEQPETGPKPTSTPEPKEGTQEEEASQSKPQ